MRYKTISSILFILLVVCDWTLTSAINVGEGKEADASIDVVALQYVVDSRLMDNECFSEFSNNFCFVTKTDATTYPYDYIGALRGDETSISRLCSNFFCSDWVLLPFQCCDSCYSLFRAAKPLRNQVSYENEIETFGMKYNSHKQDYERLTTRSDYPHLALQLKTIFLGDTTGIYSTKAFFDSIGHSSFIIPYYVLLVDRYGHEEYKEPLYEELIKCDTMKIKGLHEFTMRYKNTK